MKLLILSFSFFVTSLSLADSVTYNWPSIDGLLINNACATPTEFHSIKNISVCVETSIVSRTACRYAGEVEVCRMLAFNEKPLIDETVTEKTQCTKTEAKALVVSRLSTAMKCVAWSKPTSEYPTPDCLKFDNVKTVLGKVFNVETIHHRDGDQGQSTTTYTTYEIPNCKK